MSSKKRTRPELATPKPKPPKPGPPRDPVNLALDRAALFTLIQTAVNVELFTIPLYMTTLYSIRGTYPAPVDGQDLWPGLRPDPTSSLPSQRAFNAIFSVYVQEMLHLQLAGNLCSAMGLPPRFEPPVYDGTTLPCIGDLKNMPGYEDVRVELGPLNRNQIRLFLAIENPDWVSPIPKPAVPFAGWGPGEPLPTFGTIGHLYECIEEYMDLSYQGKGKPFTLWEKVYQRDSIQIDLFNFTTPSSHPAPEYPFHVFIPPHVNARQARAIAAEMIAAITEQGEGRDADTTMKVDPAYVPNEPNLSSDYGADDAAVRYFWDQEGHYERFQQVARWIAGIETWPQWWDSRGGVVAWRWEDLVVAPDFADEATRKFAQQRADALNDARTADQINDALDQSFSSLLQAIEASWLNKGWLERQRKDGKEAINAYDLFPYAAMQALYTRVTAVWAANGVPRFKTVSTTGGLPDPTHPAHACQGLDPDAKPLGGNTCANAVIHTCGGANSCTHQGGCGYPNPKVDGYPSVNTDTGGKGGCGTPIPVAQVFNPSQDAPWHYKVGKTDVEMKVGDPVWEKAWAIFQAKYPDAKKPTTPTNLRLVLPPS